MAATSRALTRLIVAALLLSCSGEPTTPITPNPPPPPPPPAPAPVNIGGVWDWTETLTNGCHNVGSYRFVQSDSMFGGSFGQAGNDCSGFPNDFRGDVSNGHINGTRITFRVSASGASCEYTGDVSGNPPSAIVGTLACGAPAGTWRAHPAVPVASISVEPSNGTVVVGWTLPLKALLRNAAGERLFERAVAWTSDNPAVTTVSSAGLVTGVSVGSAGITASVEAQASQVPVTAFAIASLPMTFETVLGVEVMAADGSVRTVLTRAGILEPAWSPDGATLALTVMSGLSSSWWDMCAIYTVRADGSDVRHITSRAECDHSPAWSRDGTKIAFGRGDPACFWYCGVTIWIMNADGSNAMPLTGSGSGWDTRPTWSPDGTKIAFESYDWNTDHYDIYVMSADGSGAVNLTNDLGFNTDPAWSRDGVLAFVRNGDIWVINGDGSGATNLTANLGFESNPAWSPDGTEIVFASSLENSCWYPDPPCRHAGSDLYVIGRDGGGLRQLTATEEYEANPAWLPAAAPPGSPVVAGARANALQRGAHSLDVRPQRRLRIAPQR